MFHDDHNPPHFHAFYAEYEAVFDIGTGLVLRGDLPARALALVREWNTIHVRELLDNWDRARNHVPLRPIAPLG
jgi:hypothetical protein